MSEDSKQLSVAELLARNGQQGAASSGGGRRRRSGRGISVAELTGDLPVIPSGGGRSSHAAPDADEEPVYEAPAAYEPTGYQPSSYEAPAPEPVSYDPPEAPNYSPMSGPITRYDPLSHYREPEADPPPGRSNRVMPGREMPGREMPASRHAAPADPLSAPLSDLYAADPYAPPAYEPAPPAYEPAPAAYESAPAAYESDPLSANGFGANGTPGHSALDDPGLNGFGANGAYPAGSDALGSEVSDSGRTGRRRRHAEPAEETTEVRPLREFGPDGPGGAGRWGSNAMPPADPLPQNGGRAARRRAEEAAQASPSTVAWSPSTGGFSPESAPLPLSDNPGWPQGPGPEEQRRSPQANGRGQAEVGLPAWSARRRVPTAPKNGESAPDTGGLPTSAWSLANQDQQLLSGQTVAGDLLRDGVERAERADARRLDAQRLDAQRGRGGRRGRSKRADEMYDGRTDIHDPYLDDIDDEFDDDEHDDYDDEHEPRYLAGFKRSLAAIKASPRLQLPARRSAGAEHTEYDANRRQWMILGGQSTGAAVAGMLLFKGFERMWEMLPWVALALAMIVILGLVALVRILRRTDDILSTVIAVVVGIFVTLGPLAFLLSTN